MTNQNEVTPKLIHTFDVDVAYEKLGKDEYKVVDVSIVPAGQRVMFQITELTTMAEYSKTLEPDTPFLVDDAYIYAKLDDGRRLLVHREDLPR